MRLQQQFQEAIRLANYAYSTEKAYWSWIKGYIYFHNMKHPASMSGQEIGEYLTYLVMQRHASVSTQQQALSALVFLYRNVFNWEDIKITDWCNSARPKKLPVVFSRHEAELVLSNLQGPSWLVALLMYGSGLRLLEALRLRVKDIDFQRNEITVREGKGGKDRMTVLPQKSIVCLKDQIENSSRLHQEALKNGVAHVHLPGALARKYPSAGTELAWQFIFASNQLSRDPRTGHIGRHHLHCRTVQRSVKKAISKSGITKHASCHTFRHSFATHMLESGYDIRTVQELLGHQNVNTTMIYTHVLNRGGRGVKSPVD
ncbi:integron integrase [Parendozoicomonas haliclonae]|uniref:Tyrosine recombinase XerC n=1 Tax=Parendozoicomonas haliclonae TaxID=1960125 RepID=A0A1X7AH68_9GAMM|nr:integron integrase [Parendozoicomonas haliclonae]SMA40737.1 Tyrosine recombinase XerC [Parendozoicomonas haliclonae]